MKPSVRAASLASLCLAAIALSGCAASPRSQQFRSYFLPALPPAAATAALLAEPPAIEPKKLYPVSGMPRLTYATLNLPPRPTDADIRLRRAEEGYEAGRKALQSGDRETARQEFNRAIDTLLSAPENIGDRARIEKRLEQMVETIYRYDVDSMGAGDTSERVSYDKSPLDNILEMTFPIDPNLKPKVKEQIQATVSQLPLEESDAVLSYVHFFTTDRGKRVIASGIKRAGRYKALIQRILAEEGVPQELIYLAQAESGFMPRAISYKSAVGMWQFMDFRGREYGLNRTPFNDDRLDPEKATRAAARHLKDLFTMFGDWYLAMAAYNCGPGCVDHAVQRTGYADYWKLVSLNALPKQTMNYVPVILAMTIVAKNAKDYGLDNLDCDPPVEYDTITTSAQTSLQLIADAADRPLAEIRELNPALLKTMAPASYEVHLPKGTGTTTLAALERVPASNRSGWRLHHFTTGDTIASIAKQYGTSPAAITSSNPALPVILSSGDVVLIPGVYSEPRTVVARAPVRRTTASGHVQASSVQHKGTVHRPVSNVKKSPAAPAHRRTPNTVNTASIQR